MTTGTHKARGPRRVYSPPPAVLVWVNARSLHEVPVYIQRALLRGGGGYPLHWPPVLAQTFFFPRRYYIKQALRQCYNILYVPEMCIATLM